MKDEIRIGICKETKKKLLQIKNLSSNDAEDETGWMCLHRDTEDEEIEEILEYKYNFIFGITTN